MVDAHAHAVEDSAYQMVNALQDYKDEGVYKVIFFDGWEALRAHKQKSDIIPSLYIRHMDAPNSVNDVKAALKGGFMWIGEAILRHHNLEPQVPANHTVALQIYDLCAEYRVPITVHQDTAEYKDAYKEFEYVAYMKPNCAFVLHSGWFGASEVGQIIQRHANVYVELAGALENDRGEFLGCTKQDQFAYPDGRIREEWRWTFERYQDRIMNGFDFWLEWQYGPDNLKKNVDYWRNLLGQISQEAAERIAYRNVEDLLAHSADLTTRTATFGSASRTTAEVTTQGTSISTALQTTITLETETKTAISTPSMPVAVTSETLVIAGLTIMIVAAIGFIYLQRRRK